ncbi:GIY-YIG nuclease family protein [Nocardioides sp. Soil805]|uniref:GIY-YIG nuclease family protein n=1 Tax=Nocardioides sp. Soil805 TaxID=1736416 RepID=UPI0007025684|nr:GIY-YIG nuclease family protein [Nocardioides sp. Soil805]KRF36164.1 excinuclease ABC subunit C [Nocardioides sp. Soil805]
MPWVYMLRCSDGSFYVGSTTDLDARISQHNSPDLGAAYTRRRRPVMLVWSAETELIGEAFRLEKQIQGWSRRKREALIRGDYDEVVAAARRRAGRPRDR